jgi:hypothetical protein
MSHTTLTTDIHATGEIQTHDLSRRAAADLRLRPAVTAKYQINAYSIDLLYFKRTNLKI